MFVLGSVSLEWRSETEFGSSIDCTKKKEKKVLQEEKVEEFYEDVPPEIDVPPDEEITGGNVYFDEPPTCKKKEETPPPVKQAPAIKVTEKGDAKTTFGKFLRTLRKIARSGVLFTLCMDLECLYEEDVFVLFTESDTVFRSLTKEDHFSLISQAFTELGLESGEFDLRLKAKQSDTFNKSLNEIKETFKGSPVEVK